MKAIKQPLSTIQQPGVQMNIGAIEDHILELRDTNAVLESYAQLASRADTHDATSIQQVGSFLFMVYEQQLRILDALQAQIPKATHINQQ